MNEDETSDALAAVLAEAVWLVYLPSDMTPAQARERLAALEQRAEALSALL